MYKAFQEEQFDRQTVELDEGFITYTTFEDTSIYIHILYVKPEYRSEGIGAKLENIVIDSYNPTSLYCYVDLTSRDPDISLQAILGVGYTIDSVR